MGNFIDKDDLKTQLEISGTNYDTLLDLYANYSESLWDRLTNRTWFNDEQNKTEYYDVEPRSNQLFLDNLPITEIVSIHDDPDWIWGSDTLIEAEDYRADEDAGVIHYNSYFFGGGQSVKVIYKAGYTTGTVPNWLKAVLIRQALHWFKQAQDQKWDKASEGLPDGGTISYTELDNNMLPDFAELARNNKRYA